MTEEQLAELFAVIGLANENNRLAIGYGVPVDEKFLSAGEAAFSSSRIYVHRGKGLSMMETNRSL